MIFRQLYDPETSTYTHRLADEASREAVLLDPVLEQLERDLQLIRELDLTLICTLETHVHADHVTASGHLRERCGSRVVVGAHAGVANADVELDDGEELRFGACVLEARRTPGHTDGCMTYVCHQQGMAFTGDALLIRGCGRTDFQVGSAHTLFRSVRERIFTLPDACLLYPGHDYKGRTVTTVAEEKRHNARLALDRSEAEFVAIMDGLDLAYPKRIDVAVPANLQSGLMAADEPKRPIAGVMETLGRQDAEMTMGLGI